MMLFPIRINTDIELQLLEQQHTLSLFNLIQRNRDHLDQWLRWSGRVQTLEDTSNFILRFETKAAVQDGFHAGIWYLGELVGGVVCHYLNRESHKTEIGYWLSAAYTGKGLVTTTCHTVIRHLFDDEKMNRIEIQCATDNLASRAVAERLGFTFEGIKRESEWITTGYRDHALYSLLVREWKTRMDVDKNR